MITFIYLSDNKRVYTFKYFLYFLNKVKNIKNIHLLILIHDTNKDFFINKLKKYSNIKYLIKNFDNNNNYFNKIKYSIEYSKKNKNKYILKFDNDLIVNNYVLDYMINNINLLENKDNLFITPNLSSGIPTIEAFIKNFFNNKEKQEIYNIFMKTKIPNNLWNTNYTLLNQYLINNNEWNFEHFCKILNSIDTKYKGLHPIRINKEAILYLNSWIINNKNKLFEKKEYKINISNNFCYFCNSIFLIKINDYEKILFDKTFNDRFDEIKLNKYCKKNNLNGIFINNSFSIHPIYNTILNYKKYERDLFNTLFLEKNI